MRTALVSQSIDKISSALPSDCDCPCDVGEGVKLLDGGGGAGGSVELLDGGVGDAELLGGGGAGRLGVRGAGRLGVRGDCGSCPVECLCLTTGCCFELFMGCV